MARILLADDHDLVRETLAQYLVTRGLGPVAQAGDADGVMAILAGDATFDLVLLDYNMPGMAGMAGLDRVLSVDGVAAVALISGEMRQELVIEALDRGACGFVPKTISPAAFVQAVERMIAGEIFAPVPLAPRPDEGLLSAREMDVLRGICAGKSNKEIARDHDLQEVTVKLHVKTMSRKLGARNRTHAAMIARDRKLV
ncbi:response regulator transcription factor [Rhodobacter sp. KR11]|uniref:response regulator n=1 Tax=Rhodobacter sp. KR11 TaxID=2974588 RepID=UPI002221CB67|nr:response regulator transcription factor [Rhodobacter sp. KR11]MCW1918738.1 response regulator transcription factor [Rhodobacter sp. KR11]